MKVSSRVSPAALMATLFLALSSASCGAADFGSVTHNGVTMPVKRVIAVWKEKESSLDVYLLPFEPSPMDIAGAQRLGIRYFWKVKHDSPDTSKWPGWVPFASYGLSWWDDAEVGNMARAGVYIYTFSIDKQYTNMNANFPAITDDNVVVLTGTPGVGKEITLEARGERQFGDGDLVSWDVKMTTVVLEDTSD